MNDGKPAPDWTAIRATWESTPASSLSNRALAKAHGVPESTLRKYATTEQWAPRPAAPQAPKPAPPALPVLSVIASTGVRPMPRKVNGTAHKLPPVPEPAQAEDMAKRNRTHARGVRTRQINVLDRATAAGAQPDSTPGEGPSTRATGGPAAPKGRDSSTVQVEQSGGSAAGGPTVAVQVNVGTGAGAPAQQPQGVLTELTEQDQQFLRQVEDNARAIVMRAALALQSGVLRPGDQDPDKPGELVRDYRLRGDAFDATKVSKIAGQATALGFSIYRDAKGWGSAIPGQDHQHLRPGGGTTQLPAAVSGSDADLDELLDQLPPDEAAEYRRTLELLKDPGAAPR